MNSITLIAGALLFAGALYGGVGIRHYYKVRAVYFEELLNFCNLLIDEITHLKTPLIKIFSNFTYMKKHELSKHLGQYVILLNQKVIPTKEDILEVLNCIYIKKEEKVVIADFLLSLGRTGVDSQAVGIGHYKNKFAEISKKTKEQSKVQGTLAYKLGILLGIALMILVV